MTNVSLSEDDLANLILQRTGPFLKLGGGPYFQHWMRTGEKLPLVQFLVQAGRADEYVNAALAEIMEEFAPLAPALETARDGVMVSIGPGLGLFELLVHKKTAAHLVLIDIEQSHEHTHDFAEKGSGYNNLATTRAFLAVNGVAQQRITTCNPRNEPLPKGPFDAVVSLLSMGFHYPCDEYVDFILSELKPGGILIFDLLNGTPDPGWERLAPHFTLLSKEQFSKSQRATLGRKS